MVVAVPEIASPPMNATSPATVASRGPRVSQIWPETTRPMTLATRNAVNAHPIAPMPCNSRAAVGNAAATAIASNAMRVTRIRIPALVRR